MNLSNNEGMKVQQILKFSRHYEMPMCEMQMRMKKEVGHNTWEPGWHQIWLYHPCKRQRWRALSLQALVVASTNDPLMKKL